MSIGAKITRLVVLAFSLTLLAWYVVYSQQSAQEPAFPEAEILDLPKPKKSPAVAPDPIATLAAFNSRHHNLKPELGEETAVSSPWSRPEDPILQPATISRVLNDHGQSTGDSSRLLTPENLTAKYFSAVVEARQSKQRVLMAGSKSTQVFMPAENTLMPIDSFLKRPSDPLEDPQNIQRILTDDGTHFSESESIIAPAKLAEARRYRGPTIGSSIFINPPSDPVSDFFRPLFRLLTPLTIDEPPSEPLVALHPLEALGKMEMTANGSKAGFIFTPSMFEPPTPAPPPAQLQGAPIRSP